MWHRLHAAMGVSIPAAAPSEHPTKKKAAVHLLQPVALTMLLPFTFKNSQSDCLGLFIVNKYKPKEAAQIFESCHHQFVPTSGDLTAGSCQRLGMKSCFRKLASCPD